jgi:uncharacterized protein YjiK
MKNVISILALLIIGVSDSGYDLKTPDDHNELPDGLTEISGLAHLASATFACIQDEHGILFYYDRDRNQILKRTVFHGDGDYEGIALVHGTIYVLRSDGALFEIENHGTSKPATRTYLTGITARNNEGLCYDRKGNRLLIGSKGRLGKGPEHKHRRAVYGFDLREKKLHEKPVLEINVKDLELFAKKNRLLPDGVKIKLKTSAMGIHPKTGKLFMLSAAEHLLLIFDLEKGVEHIEMLDPALFNKAEGITFNENGDMFITNEGKKQKPTLLQFNYRKGKGNP